MEDLIAHQSRRKTKTRLYPDHPPLTTSASQLKSKSKIDKLSLKTKKSLKHKTKNQTKLKRPLGYGSAWKKNCSGQRAQAAALRFARSGAPNRRAAGEPKCGLRVCVPFPRAAGEGWFYISVEILGLPSFYPPSSWRKPAAVGSVWCLIISGR